jgi:hypothetical protein
MMELKNYQKRHDDLHTRALLFQQIFEAEVLVACDVDLHILGLFRHRNLFLHDLTELRPDGIDTVFLPFQHALEDVIQLLQRQISDQLLEVHRLLV